MSHSRSRSSVGSDSHMRLEPRLLTAAGNNDRQALEEVLQLARANKQLDATFLAIGLMRSVERGHIEATQYLLSEGASVEVSRNRVAPLYRAVERNHVRIVQLLLDAGASIEATDKKGRTALMTAAWKNHWHMLQLLIARGADVNARDAKKRNILHNLAADKTMDWGDDVVNLLLESNCRIDAHDELGRTPLHWACATGKRRLAELLLSRVSGSQTIIDAVELRNKTALHVATAHDREDIIELLLKYGASVHAKSDGGWTPLHNASDKGCEKIVRLLIKAGANINATLLTGVTPLHLAAQAGHREVVECLLEQRDLKLRSRDNFGSTAFLRAAQARQKEIVQLLAPFNHVDALSEDAIGACKGFEATIVDFGNFRNENRVKRVSVYELLYERDAKNPRKQAVTTLPKNVKASDFRWIHLPANNMAWVEALLTKSFIEEGAGDVEGFKGLEKSFHYQHRGRRIHSQFMRPLCQSTPRAPPDQHREAEEEKPAEDGPPPVPQVVLNGPPAGPSAQPKTPETPEKKPKGGGRLDRLESLSQDDDNVSQKKKGRSHPRKSNTKTGNESPKPDAKLFKTKSSMSDKKVRLPSSPSGRDLTQMSARSNICIFMPYLHFETTQGRQKMQEAIHRAEICRSHPGLMRASTHDEMLIRAHLISSTASLHVRRTLDQFFYPNIDTQVRDEDQVVYRYQKKWPEETRPWHEPKIFMVDQLWMWILGKNLIVTSFPQRWEQPKNDPLNVLDGIIEDINSKTREPVQSVYDLATVITGRCSGIFDRHRMGDEEYQFLDMFESSIGTATDRETVLFRDFNTASAQASEWLKRHHSRPERLAQNIKKITPSVSRHRRSRSDAHRPSIHTTEQVDDSDPANRKDPESEATAVDDNSYKQPLFVDRLLDIGQETDLLAETKDIRDELNMIRTVLEYQRQVLLDLQDSICELYLGEHRSQSDIKKRFRDQQRIIDMHVKDVDRMDKQTERIYESITDLLDLKQKHANALEARFARDQAAGTTRQGKTIMMFTIVTIIFLPLSFIASVFAINVAEFPHANGNTNIPIAYASKYIFGIGFAISIPLILLALSVDDIRHASREAYRSIKHQFRSRSAGTKKGHAAKISASSISMHHPHENFPGKLSLTRSRRRSGSIESEFSGTLLPVATRRSHTSRRSSNLRGAPAFDGSLAVPATNGRLHYANRPVEKGFVFKADGPL